MISITDCELKGEVIIKGENFYVKAHKHFDGVNTVFVIYNKDDKEVARAWNKKISLIILVGLEPEKPKKYLLPNFFKDITKAIQKSSFPEPNKSDMLRNMRELRYKPHIVFDWLKKNFKLF